MSRAAILRALETGLMREQAKDLSRQERQAVAGYLADATNKEAQSAAPVSARCNTEPGTKSMERPGPGTVLEPA
jgi:hypothetical protein